MKKLLTLILGIALLATLGGLVTVKAATVNGSKSNTFRGKPTPTPTPTPKPGKPKPTPTPTPKPKK